MTQTLTEKKKRGKRGFSLAELLFALLITSLSGLIVIGGIGVTTRLFQDVLLHSQTQLVMKEYMSELRSGFLSAEMDSALNVKVFDESITDATEREAMINPAFAHSGYKRAGFYTTMPATGETSLLTVDGKDYGVIMFQPALYDYTNNTAQKTAATGETMPQPLRLISAHLSDDFPAWVEYTYVVPEGETDGHFVLSLTVRSKNVLSTGEHVVLSVVKQEITPTGK